jgi:hypothetical protein
VTQVNLSQNGRHTRWKRPLTMRERKWEPSLRRGRGTPNSAAAVARTLSITRTKKRCSATEAAGRAAASQYFLTRTNVT